MKKAILSPKSLTTLIMILLLAFTMKAQETFFVDASSKMSILGTSTIHDWESAVTELDGSALIALEGKSIQNIENLTFSLPVESIESGNSIMDGKTYNALKSKEHPKITYRLTDLKVTNGICNSKGKLTVAGVTRDIEFPVECKVKGDLVNVMGKINFKMKDFKVDPPTALMGTLKTGDDVTISFDVNFSRQSL